MFEEDEEEYGVEEQESADPVEDTDEESDDDSEVEYEESEDYDAEESEETQEVAEPEITSRNLEEDSKFAAARRDSEKQLKILKDRQDAFAKQHGYNTFDEMEDYLSKQKYVESGVSEELADKLIKNDKLYKMMEEQAVRTRINEEKSRLKGQLFFNELEPDIDLLVEQNPNLSIEVAFNYMKGVKMGDLMKNAKKAAAQKALNDASSKTHIKSDGKGVDIDTTQVDDTEWGFYKALNPKAKKDDYIKFMKKEKRR